MQILFDVLRSQFLAQIITYFVPIIVTALLGWAAVLYTRLTGRQLDAQNRDSLQSALSNGVLWAIQQLLASGGKLNADGTVPDAARAGVLSAAQSYVMQSAPGAIKHFKLTPNRLEMLTVPHLPPPANVARPAARRKAA